MLVGSWDASWDAGRIAAVATWNSRGRCGHSKVSTPYHMLHLLA